MKFAVPQSFLSVVAALAVGCASPPTPADPVPEPFYKISYDMEKKAVDFYAQAVVDRIDEVGQFLYKVYLPWGDDPRGANNYLRSHDLADLPAWHGMLTMGLALDAAESKTNDNGVLSRLADGLLKHFEVTGVEGLLARSTIPSYSGPRLPWMEDSHQRPTKYWQRGTNANGWWRNGLAKNHWNMAACGAGMVLYLDRTGEIAIGAEARAKYKRLLLGLVRHLSAGGWRIRDANGKFTEFGDLRPDVSLGPDWPSIPRIPNGFNRVVVLAALKSAAELDTQWETEYAVLSRAWAGGISSSMEAVGAFVSALGHDRLGKPSYSDMQAFATASLLLLLQEPDNYVRKHVSRALASLWKYMKHENNPAFSLVYDFAFPGEGKIDRVIRLLRHFPGPDGKRAYRFEKKETSHYQPIENRPPNTNYWKSSPFRRFTKIDTSKVTTNPDTGSGLEYSGADYLYAYHLGRWLQRIPER